MTMGCLLTALGVICVHILLPVQITEEPVTIPNITATKPATDFKSQTIQTNLPTLASFASAWDLRLRPVEKVVPPPPKPTTVTAPPPPPANPFTAKLTGTIIEPNHSMALFTTQTGDIQFVSLDQMIEDAKVVDIQPEQVILERNGQTLTLQIIEPTSNNQHRPTTHTRPSVYQRRRPLR